MTDADFDTMQQAAACGFEPIERRGRGSYGIVYEVGNAQGEVFAFKYIPARNIRSGGIEDLVEIDVLSRVEHPHIMHAVDIITQNNCNIQGLALILPLAERTLSDWIKLPTVTTQEKLPVLYRLATGLDFLHRNGILHLDIKGDNVVMNGNTPYFIDFGLAMLVDNAQTGASSERLRVTVNHRAPEILAGSNIYNGAVDVWAFGIMTLFALGAVNLYQVNYRDPSVEEKIYQEIQDLFTLPEVFDNIIATIMPIYQSQMKDLLFKMLALDPQQRITAGQIVAHPVFDRVRVPITGRIKQLVASHHYAPDHRNILKILVQWVQKLYPQDRVVVLFLAVDLYYRAASYYREKSATDRMGLAATCVFMAIKLITNLPVNTEYFVKQVTVIVPQITVDQILSIEVELLDYLQGVLYEMRLYTAADNSGQLARIFTDIIMNQDSTIYLRVDIPAYMATLRHITDGNKDLLVREFLR